MIKEVGILCLFLATAAAITCHRCISIEGDAASYPVSFGDHDCRDPEYGQPPEDVATEAGVSPAPTEPPVVGEECSTATELPAVAAFMKEVGIVTWADLLGVTAATPAPGTTPASEFSCQKVNITVTSTEFTSKLSIVERGCAYRSNNGCSSTDRLREERVYINMFAQIYRVSNATVSVHGEVCVCDEELCNAGWSTLPAVALHSTALMLVGALWELM